MKSNTFRKKPSGTDRLIISFEKENKKVNATYLHLPFWAIILHERYRKKDYCLHRYHFQCKCNTVSSEGLSFVSILYHAFY